jgi:hypothetical protein
VVKAVIVGIFNPKSQDPKDAMEPFTKNGSGERLWKMLCEVHRITREEYRETFLGLNVVDRDPKEVDWSDLGYLSRRRKRIYDVVGSRSTAVLGITAWSALQVEDSPIRKVDWFGRKNNWWLFPHPSGLCRVYNDPAMRRRAGETLAKIGGLL